MRAAVEDIRALELLAVELELSRAVSLVPHLRQRGDGQPARRGRPS